MLEITSKNASTFSSKGASKARVAATTIKWRECDNFASTARPMCTCAMGAISLCAMSYVGLQ
jgi:hypothetical protein